MKLMLRIARLALPTVFFGYAIVANIALLSGPHPEVVLPETGLLSGGLTRDLDASYKKDLLHMPVSFSLIGAARYAFLGEARTGAIVGRSGWLFSEEELRPYPSQAQLQDIIATVLEVEEELQRAGTELVVVPLPAKIDIYRAFAPEPRFGSNIENLYTEFFTQLAAQGVDLVDARSALWNPSNATFFATDTHWTPYGATLVANAVAASGKIPPGIVTFERTEQSPKALIGDLVSFVTSPEIAPHIGLGSESIQPVVLTPVDALADIFGSAEADIVLVGTSYSANPDWGFPNALMLALGRDVISEAEYGLGPLQPMQDYLDAQDEYDTPPAVVIWEIPVRYLTDDTLWPDAADQTLEIAFLTTEETSGE